MQDNNTGKTRNSEAAGPSPEGKAEGLANSLQVERNYTPDRNAMLAALRVVLGLPRVPPGWIEELTR